MITAGTLQLGGDLLCQIVENKDGLVKKSWDYKRSTRILIWGFIGTGPILHNWYKLIDKMVPGKELKHTLIKVQLYSLHLLLVVTLHLYR